MSMFLRTLRLAPLLLLCGLAACDGGHRHHHASDGTDPGSPTDPGTPGDPGTPTTPSAKAGHVFVVVLENKNYAKTFATDAPNTYLPVDLVAKGALLQQYYGTGHVSLDNYLSMISGQGPNLVTQSDCQQFQEFSMVTAPSSATSGQAIGQGCVFPTSVPNLTDQLVAKGLSWKGYMEDMGNTPTRESATCGHPTVGGSDGTQVATADDSYATRHNPFMYFHSIIDDQASCDAHVVNLSALDADLATIGTTPNFTFITPSLCHDGHDSPCANGEPGGLESIDAFLRVLVPKILASDAWKKDGVLIITFDESDGPQSDSSGCCGAGPTANSALPGLTGVGGGQVGAVILSPYVKAGTVSTQAYNHYSLLRSVQDLFGLPYLGYAGASAQTSFGSDVYTQQMPELPPKS